MADFEKECLILLYNIIIFRPSKLHFSYNQLYKSRKIKIIGWPKHIYR